MSAHIAQAILGRKAMRRRGPAGQLRHAVNCCLTGKMPRNRGTFRLHSPILAPVSAPCRVAHGELEVSSELSLLDFLATLPALRCESLTWQEGTDRGLDGSSVSFCAFFSSPAQAKLFVRDVKRFRGRCLGTKNNIGANGHSYSVWVESGKCLLASSRCSWINLGLLFFARQIRH